MQERMNMFWRRCEGKEELTKDPILREYKFTNVYRACDRVSQYLIRRIIYKDIDHYTPEDTVLRILIFKIFNKPSTWEYIQEQYGDLRTDNFDSKSISIFVTTTNKGTLRASVIPRCSLVIPTNPILEPTISIA